MTSNPPTTPDAVQAEPAIRERIDFLESLRAVCRSACQLNPSLPVRREALRWEQRFEKELVALKL